MTSFLDVAGAEETPESPVPAAISAMANAFDYTFEETLLKIENLSLAYGDKVILRDINLDLRNIVRPAPHTQGQVEVWLAPSGTGKSQLYSAIAGVPHKDAKITGNILNAAGEPIKRGGVGLVSQTYPLFAHLTVLDNLLLSTKDKDRCLEFLERFGLSEQANSYPKYISGGQRQRAAIIQQMISCGHFLLMDEPFSGLDPKAKKQVQQLISGVAAQDELNTVIVTTHDIHSAVSIADTIKLMGHERDANGAKIPGAKFVMEYNLIDMGLTWRDHIEDLPQYNELVKDINHRFETL